MPLCHVCHQPVRAKVLQRRLAVPEYRSLTGFWPWGDVEVCGGCVAAFDQDFAERLALLAPSVLENDEPIAGPVCLACGALESGRPWTEAAKWVGPDGRPVRRARFRLCPKHCDMTYVEGVIVATNLADAARMRSVLEELPAAAADLLDRVEAWRPGDGRGPPGACDVPDERPLAEAAETALAFWLAAPDGLEARGAWMGPVRRNYRLRYRLDLAADFADGRRETLAVVRLGPDRFATYRPAPPAP